MRDPATGGEDLKLGMNRWYRDTGKRALGWGGEEEEEEGGS